MGEASGAAREYVSWRLGLTTKGLEIQDAKILEVQTTVLSWYGGGLDVSSQSRERHSEGRPHAEETRKRLQR